MFKWLSSTLLMLALWLAGGESIWQAERVFGLTPKVQYSHVMYLIALEGGSYFLIVMCGVGAFVLLFDCLQYRERETQARKTAEELKGYFSRGGTGGDAA